MRKLKNIKLSFLLIVALAFGGAVYFDAPVSVTPRVEASVATFRTALIADFTNTNNFTIAQRNEIADAFVSAYNAEWLARIADGTYTDTAANRGQFAVDKMIFYMRDIHRDYRRKLDFSAVPTPTPLP
jgi:hypothetical protein